MSIPLADAVLPLIRTRADLHRFSKANQHGSQMHEAIDTLEAAVLSTDPAEVHAVTQEAPQTFAVVGGRTSDI